MNPQNLKLTAACLYNPIVPETSNNLDSLRDLISDDKIFEQKLGNFLLEKYKKKLKLNKKKVITKRNFIKRTYRQLRFFKIPQECSQFELYIPLNKIWNSYIQNILGNEKNEENFLNKLLQCDFHGSSIKILAAKCQTYEGQSGIVIQETNRTFRIVTKMDKIITILKKNCVFLVDVCGRVAKIYGQQLEIRPADREKTEPKYKNISDFIFKNIELCYFYFF